MRTAKTVPDLRLSTLWQSFNRKTCLPSDVHLYSLCLQALTKESLGDTAPMAMGVSPKVQAICLLALPKESLAYTVLTGVCLALSLQRKKSYSPFRQKSSFVSPRNFDFARITSLAFTSFNPKVRKIISIIIAHKHCHVTPGT